MSSKISRLKGRSIPASTPHISLRFKPADDDAEELSYEVEPPSAAHNHVSSKNVPDPLLNSHISPCHVEKKRNASEEKTVAEGTNDLNTVQPKEMNITDQSKGDDSEKWKVLNEIRGKITKTLEDRINKDSIVTGVALQKDIAEGIKSEDFKDFNVPENNGKLDFVKGTQPLENISDSSQTNNSHLSPSIEATEFINQFFFDNDVGDEFEKSTCVITCLPEKQQKPFSATPSSTQSLLNQKRQKSPGKSNISMSFSNLVATRSQSIEEEYVETCEAVKNEEYVTTSLPVSTPEGASSEDLNVEYRNEKWQQLKLRIRSYSIFAKSLKNMLTVLFVLLACILAPLPSYLSGFLLGTLVSSLCFGLFWLLMKPTRQREHFSLPDFSKIPLPVTPAKTEEQIYKGWMNELQTEYSPDSYHVNSTHSVYVRLDGSYLRISHPETNIPKRAMFNEPRHKVTFVHQRHYDITGSYLSLLPDGLSRTRLWSKKYPLRLSIPNPKQAILSGNSNSKIAEDNSCITQNIKESSNKKFLPRINENNEVVLYLFARTDREKDDWYRRFTNAAKVKTLGSTMHISTTNVSSIDHSSLENKRAISIDLGSLKLSSSTGNECSEAESEVDSNSFSVTKKRKLTFDHYLTSLLSPSYAEFLQSCNTSSSFNNQNELSDKSTKSNQNLLWLNALLGRLFYDFLTKDFWSKLVSERVQRKLSKIKVPYFIEELTVTEIDLGCAIPKIHRVSEAVVNEQGFWMDFDLSYNGCFQMTLETKLNLLRLQKSPSGELTLNVMAEEKQPTRTIRSDLGNSEEDDSAESSSDEESLPDVSEQTVTEESPPSAVGGGSTSKKLLRFVDKIAQSPYFQHAAKNKYIKRAMEEVSNTPLVLTVEIQWLTGTLAVNVPPLPTDRLWYGFRRNPHLSLVARPKLGVHAVKFTHVTEWIEKKLISEFQKVLVMPNMGNIVIPIMHFNLPAQKS